MLTAYRRRGSWRRAGALLLVVGALSACSRAVPPIGAGTDGFTPLPGERELWKKAEDETAPLLQRVATHDDPRLTEYLGRIADRILPDRIKSAGAPGITFTVIRDPALYAFSLSTGRIFVSTGLLSRLGDEAQLAMVIAHELMHLTHRHALQYARNAPYREAAELFPSIAIAVNATLTPQ
ncbi:MAG: M48 family metalloprotease, partial [Candidatus Rokubacteria bacterium]|nr:M48 family metalloprotease [Candidatus Rokubacteria bacterium]